MLKIKRITSEPEKNIRNLIHKFKSRNYPQQIWHTARNKLHRNRLLAYKKMKMEVGRSTLILVFETK